MDVHLLRNLGTLALLLVERIDRLLLLLHELGLYSIHQMISKYPGDMPAL